MAATQNQSAKVPLSIKDKINLLVPYAKKKIWEQVQAVALIVMYLIIFQTLVLGIPIAESALIAIGISVIVLGLAFFMEGLFLGLMPLGEVIGIRLPQKSKLPVILGFSFILGVGVTFAEPAIGVLQLAGSTIQAWDAPLLFLLLNKHADALKLSVGLGVGVAVVLGMLRFMYQISLKPYLYIGVPIITVVSVIAFMEPNLGYLLSVAWDAGGVTTGPVTVPLVLALGIGISRVVSKGDTESGGFGVVTLASLLPVYAVIILGVLFLPSVPSPLDQKSFFAAENREKVTSMFEDSDALIGYALKNASVDAQLQLFDGSQATMDAYITKLKNDADLRKKVFGNDDPTTLEKWAVTNGSLEQRLLVFGSEDAIKSAVTRYSSNTSNPLNVADLLQRNGLASVQAILPLTLFLVGVLLFILREKLPRADEILVGVFFAILGMFLFNIGIELGLSKLGNQVGSKVPSSFKRIELVEQSQNIRNFDEELVLTSISPSGQKTKFFYTNLNGGYVQIPFEAQQFDSATGSYTYVPTKGPLFGSEENPMGFVLVLLFAFIMGYGATLAEPALNALGATVEILTVGAFKKNLLMQTVAIGVGIGIAMGVVKIIWNIPLVWIIGPPYVILMLLTFLSTEEFVNIGWDSAGVTTGPITVPLVLAMGLGIATQVGAVEGFGILASASVFPIMAVLLVGLIVNGRKKNTSGTQGA